MRFQRGVSLNGLMIGSIIFAVVALLAMKVLPEWIEFGKIKKAVASTAGDIGLKEASIAQVKASYVKRQELDDIKSVSADDLDITKESGELVISFAYTKKVPLFANVSLVFDFEGSSAKQ
jgi:hypothetical protein